MLVDPGALSADEHTVLSLLTEDAFALWEVVHEVGGDRALAAAVLRSLLGLGLIQFGVEDWAQDPPANWVTGKYVDVPLTETVEEALAEDPSWNPEAIRKVVVSATPAGYDAYLASAGASPDPHK